MPNQQYLPESLREFRRLKSLAERAVAQVDDDAYFRVLGDDGNSPAIIVKHLAGNMRSRWRDFLTSDGEKPDRNRDGEFVITDADDRASLTASWQRSWALLFAAVEPLQAVDLQRTVTIRGEPHTVLQAVARQLSHYAYHVGQLVLLGRIGAGTEWRSLSVPRNASDAFNAVPAPYLDPDA